MKQTVRGLGALAGLWLALLPAATASDGVETRFERPAALAPTVAFWTDVFARYSRYQVVLHAMDHPSLVLSVLDFRDQVPELRPEELRLRMIRAERKEKRRLDERLRAIRDAEGDETLDAEARALKRTLDEHSPAVSAAALIGRVRGQRGLREKTHEALERAASLLPYMEARFRHHGLPLELTRLPIVESSFDSAAYSKVGAAGLWQFIPSSARRYMQLDEAVDQRRDPWFSTDAAARHLRDDYAALGDWPLAVTAYNYGRSGIARALKAVRGETLMDLIERYDNPRFGFASRNFYAEFLAAVDVVEAAATHFPDLSPRTPVDFETVRVDAYVPYETLRRVAGVEPSLFRELNPSFSEPVLKGQLHVAPDHVLRVPAGGATAFHAAYSALAADQRHERQREYWRQHRVRRGDSLISIAKRYGTTARAVQRANAIRDPHLIRIGQRLKIPPADGSRGAVSRPAVHTVRSGQSLWTISRLYRVSLDALRDANGLDGTDLIRSGTRLKIPH